METRLFTRICGRLFYTKTSGSVRLQRPEFSLLRCADFHVARTFNRAIAATTDDLTAYDSIDKACVLAKARQRQNFGRPDIVLYGNTSCYDTENKIEEIIPIEAHKNVLASASPYMRDAFKSKSFIESDAKKYNIDQIDHESLRLIVACIYQPKVYVSGKNVFKRVENVLIGADYLLMPEMVHACGRRLVDKPEYLNLSTCVCKWLFAKKYRCEVLASAAIYVAATNLNAVSKQQEFLSLSHENMVQLVKNLAAKTVYRRRRGSSPPPVSPATLFDSALAWLKADVDNGAAARKTWCDLVMRHVPFQNMTTSELKHVEASGRFLSVDVLTKVKQMKQIRAQLDNMTTLFKAVLEDGENFRGEMKWMDVKYYRSDSESQDDDGNDIELDDENEFVKKDAKSLKTHRRGRRILAHRLLGLDERLLTHDGL